MGMRDYAIEAYGLVMDSNTLHMLAAQTDQQYSEQAWDKDKWAFIDRVIDKFGLSYISQFTGEAFQVDESGYDNYDAGNVYSCDFICYADIRHCPSLFKAAYKNIDEAISEFRQRFGNALPSNFNYIANFKHIVGTEFG